MSCVFRANVDKASVDREQRVRPILNSCFGIVINSRNAPAAVVHLINLKVSSAAVADATRVSASGGSPPKALLQRRARRAHQSRIKFENMKYNFLFFKLICGRVSGS